MGSKTIHWSGRTKRLLAGVCFSAFLLGGCTGSEMRSLFGDTISSQKVAATSTENPKSVSEPSQKIVGQDPIDEVVNGRSTAKLLTRPLKPTAAGDIQLNFNEVPIKDVVQVVLGDYLGGAYVIDPNVQGTISLTTATPINRESLLPLLDVALGAAGAEVISVGDAYRIKKRSGGGRTVGSVGGGFLALPLNFIGAEEMAKILRPVLPQDRPLIASRATNLLLVGGSASELDMVRKTAEVFDIDAMAEQSVLLKSLQNVQVGDILFELENIFGAAEKGPLAGQVRFVPVARLNAVMVLSRQPTYLDEARRWIDRLDRTHHADERGIFVYYMQHGRVKDMAQTLQALFSDEGLVVSSNTSDPDAQVARNSTKPSIQADETRNALLVQATPKQYQQIQGVLAKLDVAPAQVMIEAQIVEVTLDDSLRFGVQYALDVGGLGLTADGQAVLSQTNSSTIAPTFGAGSLTPGGFAFTLTGTGGQARVVLDALSATTEVNVVSAPKVFVLDNQPAELSVGDEVPIITQTATATNTDSRTVNTVEYRSTGVQLNVTPRINAGGLVTLEISQDVSAAVNTQTSTIDSPTIQQRSIVSTVSVRDGETVLLGGLIREQSGKGKSGIPILSDIPVLGALFGTTSTTGGRTELLVMITPRVVKSVKEVREITEQLRSQFDGVLRAEKRGFGQPGLLN